MSVQLALDPVSLVRQHRATSRVVLIGEPEPIQIAPFLRKRSRELRAKSEALRRRNSDVILRASEVAARVMEGCQAFSQLNGIA